MPAFPSFAGGNNPSLPAELTEETFDGVIRGRMEDGYGLARTRHSRARDKWSVTYRNLSQADYATLMTFYKTTVAQSGNFTWTHPITSATKTVRFASAIKRSYAGYFNGVSWNVSFELEEI